MSESIKDSNWLNIPLHPGRGRQDKSDRGRTVLPEISAFGSDLPDLSSMCLPEESSAGSPHRPAEGAAPTQDVLVIGLGDENRGDRAIGLHLLNCLERMDWPGNVTFSRADANIHRRADDFRHVIVLDAIEGVATPGSLYQAAPGEMIGEATGSEFGLGLLAMLSPAARRRLSVFGIHPGTTRWGAPMSMAVLSSVSILLSVLRARILETAARHGSVN